MEDMFNIVPSSNKEVPALSVSEASFKIKRCVETNFSFIKIKGEIFGGKRADSGHWYLTLKDENASLSAVIWRGVASHLNFKPEDGLEVIATGKITTFAGKSSYQMIIESLEIAGQGSLLKLLEERKQAYLKEGLFSPQHKKPIPFLPNLIGVVTSASGAVIRDIIHRVRDRFPSPIILIPTAVQGEGAAEKIAQAIKDFNRLDEISDYPKPDVLIVARGGGSLEDLWPFNEDCVIRAVYNSDIPIISAVGHETDTMLIDYVADKRAPTPTGAAEFAVPVKTELQATVNDLDARLKNSILRYFDNLSNNLIGLSRGIPDLSQILQEATQKFDDRIERLNLAFSNLLKNKNQQLSLCGLKPYYIKNIIDKNTEIINNLSSRLAGVSVDSVLSRGFAWIKNNDNQTVYNLASAQKAESLNIRFIDGSLTTYNQPQSVKSKKLVKPKPHKKEKTQDEKQISLFDF